jgi:peptidoglycan hydrolase-like protein with peptidoglycan-binding domain
MPRRWLPFTSVNVRILIPLTCALLASAGPSVAFASDSGAAGGTSVQTTPTTSTPPTPPATGQTTPATTTTAPAATPPVVAPPKPTLHTRITAFPHSSISDGTAPLRVKLSGAPAPGSPAPMLTPAVAGKWTVVGDYESFAPKSTLEPCSSYTLTVGAGTTVRGDLPLGGKRRQYKLNVACPGLQALQQALSRLNYLPYAIDASHGRNSGNKAEARALAARYAFNPPAAKMVANVPHAPGLRYGALDPTTRGAVIVFQANHDLSPTGSPDGSMWASLLAAETLGHGNPEPYTFVTVSESIPETLEVHRGSHVVLSTPANTGVAGATTEQGTFPISARYTSTTMTGTNPDGSHYSDPGVPWVNYFNGGDAVHGFPRPSYGSPQSNGCVELPIGTAARVYPLLAIGDLVIVS